MSCRLGACFGVSEARVGLRGVFSSRDPRVVLLVETSVFSPKNIQENERQISVIGKDAVCINVTKWDSLKAITHTVQKVFQELSTPVVSVGSGTLRDVVTTAFEAGVRDFIAPSISEFHLMKQLTSKLPVTEPEDLVNLGVEISLDVPKSVISSIAGIGDVGFIITSPVVDLISKAPVFRELKNTGIPTILRFPAPPDTSKQVLFAKQIGELPLSWTGLDGSEKKVVEQEGLFGQ